MIDMTIGQYARALGLSLSGPQLSSAGREASKRCRAAGLSVRVANAGNQPRNHYPLGVLSGMADDLREMAKAPPGAFSGSLTGGKIWRACHEWTLHPAAALLEAERAGADPETIDALRREVADWLGFEIIDDADEAPEPIAPKPGREAGDVAAAVDAMIDVILAAREAADDPADDDQEPAADDWLTVREFALSRGFVLSEGQLSSAGHEAARRCRREGVEPGRVFDGRRNVNTYPPAVLTDMLAGFASMAASGYDATEGEIPGGLAWKVWRPWSSIDGDRAAAAV